MWQHKLYSFITIFGFAISLMFIILISIYVQEQLSVDQFHVNKGRVYRLINENDGHFPPPMGQRVMGLLPELEAFTRLKDMTGLIDALNGNKQIFNYLLADAAFFNIFSFRLLEGVPDEVLQTKNSIVLSQSFANLLFGDSSPMGKVVKLNKEHSFVVTGIMEDMPHNTSVKNSEAIINFSALADIWGWEGMEEEYGSCSFAMYYLARENTDLPSKAPILLNDLKQDFWIYQEGWAKTISFEPLEENYFSQIHSPAKKQGSKTQVFVLSGIVVLILFLAIVNYINLSLAHAAFRGKEIAIKKLVGSSRRRLFWQLITESVVLCLLAFLTAILLSFLAEPIVNNLLGAHIDLFNQFHWYNFFLFLSLLLGVGVVAGFIPALVITSFNALEVVKGTLRKKSKQVYGKGLIAFQYCIVIVLLISTWMIARQTQFLRDYQLGFDKSNVLWISSSIKPAEKENIRNIIENIPGVEGMSFVAGSPLDGGNNQSYQHNGKPVSFQTFTVDSSFFSLLNISYTPTGVALSKEAVLLNRAAVEELELDDLPGSLKWYEEVRPVYGVVENFHFRKLHEKEGPAAFIQMGPEEHPWQILVKLSGKNTMETVGKIKEAYSAFTGGYPTDYGFMDDTISQWYQQEENTAKIIGYFTLLAVIISVLGILAMATYYIKQRQKEIGIRKVIGSESLEILMMLNKDFLKWVFISFIIACPIAWYAIDRWLQNFAYRTEISWWIFALAGISAMAVALLTISWQSWRAASRNPVDSLRYE